MSRSIDDACVGQEASMYPYKGIQAQFLERITRLFTFFLSFYPREWTLLLQLRMESRNKDA